MNAMSTSKRQYHEVKFDDAPFDYVMQTLQELGVDTIKYDSINKSFKFTADALIEIKSFGRGKDGIMTFRLDNAKAVEPKENTNKTIRCYADGCNSIAKYKITENFEDPKDRNCKTNLFTQTWYWCNDHNHYDNICEGTNKDIEKI